MEDTRTYTAEEVANIYRYQVNTVWKRCRMFQEGHPNGWPHRRDGRMIRFTDQDLESIDQIMNPTVTRPQPKRKRRSLAA